MLLQVVTVTHDHGDGTGYCDHQENRNFSSPLLASADPEIPNARSPDSRFGRETGPGDSETGPGRESPIPVPGRNRDTGNPPFPDSGREFTGIGVPIGRKSGNRGCPSV